MKKLFKCMHCGNIVEKIEDKGVPVVCCGQKMEELVPNTTDAAQEKHVPVIEVSGSDVVVKVGSVEHPMLEEHHIAFIVLETNLGTQRKFLDVAGKPEAKFVLAEGEEVVAAYEYCNLHGFWKGTAV